MRMQWEQEIFSASDLCDETVEAIPDGSTLVTNLTYHIRRDGPCESPIGTHEGKFKIFDPEGKMIATGKMNDTNGINHFATPCCEPTYGEGKMEGRLSQGLIGKGKCKFTVTYQSYINTTEDDACNEDYWTNWTLFIDGIVQCRCTQDEGS